MSPALRGRLERKSMIQYALAAVVGILGIYMMWRAGHLHGAGASRTFAVGTLLVLLAVAWAWHWRSMGWLAREGMLETQMQNLRQDLRRLDRELASLRADQEVDLAAAAIRQAVDRVEVRAGRRARVQLVRDEEPSSRS